MGLSKTHRRRVICLLKIRISAVVEQLPYIEAPFPTSFLLTGHGNVRLDSDEAADAADDSDVPAAAMLQARSFGSAR